MHLAKVPRTPTLRPAPLAALLVLAALAGCARTGPPGGGPADSTPPVVESTTPEAGATSVDQETEIRIEFGEEMNRVSVERAFSIDPAVPLRNLTWDGRTLVAQPKESLPDSSTFLVSVSETAQDYHGIAMDEPFMLLFSTGVKIDTGSIAGLVVRSAEPLAGAIIWACSIPPGPDGAGVIRPCGYQTLSGPDGTFQFGRVRSSQTPYSIFAFVDVDGDGVCSVNTEVGRLAETRPLVDQDGAQVTGIVVDLTEGNGTARPEEE
ncbi:MAG: Ig-like domain-containing protein [Candidatus Eisenbacteria bacterium]|nr:Ig-like domain-containing protein [Candidatus Eisenbacteria bacterium]